MRSSTKESTRSRGGNAELACRRHRARRRGATRRPARRRAQRSQRRDPLAHLRHLPHSPLGCRARRSCSPRPPSPATGATWNDTSFLHWDASACAGSGPTTSRRSTAGSFARPTGTGSHPRPSTRSTSSSAGRFTDAVRRGLVTRNVALVAHAPRMRALPKVEQRSWTAEELQAFLGAAAGHRLFAALWTAGFTGMRRNELLGLCWDDLDVNKATLSVNRGLIAVGYDLHQTRGKTPNARRRIDLDPDHHRRTGRVAVVADHRAARRRHRAIGPDVHRRGWRSDPPARRVPNLRAHRPARRRVDDPPARLAPHTARCSSRQACR